MNLKAAPGIRFLAIAFALASASLGKADQILQHPVVLDAQGKILSWVKGDSPYDQLMRLAWKQFKSIPLQANGLPTFYTYPRFIGDERDSSGPFLSGVPWCHNPAGFNAMLADSALDYAAYSGDEELFSWIRSSLDYQRVHGMTPQAWDWSRVPFASSDPGELEYRGGDDHRYCADGSACGRGDGPGVIEPDKVGELGYAYVRFFERTDDLRYLEAALDAANALTRHLRSDADTLRSPWPFRVDGETGLKIREEYSANVLGPIMLFDELLHLKKGNQPAFLRAREVAWTWLMRYPMRNQNWSGYFEDIPIYKNPAGNPNQLTPLETARYLLLHPELDPNWQSHVRGILGWVKSQFAVDVVSHGVMEAGIQWGAEVLSEQREDMDKMASHTARFASVLALWYEKTGDPIARDRAFRSFNWATYFFQDNGVVKSSLDDATGYWFSDGYGDLMRHYLKGMGSIPAWAPVHEDHLLRSTSVVRSVAYSGSEIRYETFDRQAVEVLRVQKVPASITAGTRALQLFPISNGAGVEGYRLESLATGGYILRISHQFDGKLRIKF